MPLGMRDRVDPSAGLALAAFWWPTLEHVAGSVDPTGCHLTSATERRQGVRQTPAYPLASGAWLPACVSPEEDAFLPIDVGSSWRGPLCLPALLSLAPSGSHPEMGHPH